MESYGSFQVQTVLLSPTVGGGQHGSSTSTELVEVMLSRPQGSAIQNTLHAMEPPISNSRTRTVLLPKSSGDVQRPHGPRRSHKVRVEQRVPSVRADPS